MQVKDKQVVSWEQVKVKVKVKVKVEVEVEVEQVAGLFLFKSCIKCDI